VTLRAAPDSERSTYEIKNAEANGSCFPRMSMADVGFFIRAGNADETPLEKVVTSRTFTTLKEDAI